MIHLHHSPGFSTVSGFIWREEGSRAPPKANSSQSFVPGPAAGMPGHAPWGGREHSQNLVGTGTAQEPQVRGHSCSIALLPSRTHLRSPKSTGPHPHSTGSSSRSLCPPNPIIPLGLPLTTLSSCLCLSGIFCYWEGFGYSI